MPARTHDAKCFTLAERFLSDHPHLDTDKRIDELASLIQSTIDEYIAEANSNYEGPDPMHGVEFPFARNH